MESRSVKIKKFLNLIEDLGIESDPVKKKMIFDIVKSAWSEVGELPEVIAMICKKLKIGRDTFSMCVENPELIMSVERISQYINDGFLRDYLDYTTLLESPEEFHLWVGMTIISAAVRRNVTLDYGLFKDICNIYTVMVAPPGSTRKTTACDAGMELLEKAIPNFTIIKNKVTPEGLALTMSKIIEECVDGTRIITKEKKAHCMLYASELTVMLGTESYLASFSRLLTDLHDAKREWTYRSVAHGNLVLRDNYLVLLGCTTPVELPKAISNTTGEGGLMSRLNIIYKPKTTRSFPIPVDYKDRITIMQEKLTMQIKAFANLRNVEFRFTDDGAKWYSNWYDDVWKRLMESNNPNSTFSTRDDVKIRKIAMIIALSEGNYSDLNEDVLDRAHKILGFCTESTRSLLGMGHGGTPTSEAAQKMLDCIYKAGGHISMSNLLKCMYHKRFLSKDVEIILDMLQEGNLIKKFDMKGKVFIRLIYEGDIKTGGIEE